MGKMNINLHRNDSGCTEREINDSLEAEDAIPLETDAREQLSKPGHPVDDNVQSEIFNNWELV